MKKETFKKQVLKWLKENDIDVSDRKIRVYNYRGQWEVRIYEEPVDIVNRRRSFRIDKEKTKEMNDGRRHGHSGYFERKITMYQHINEDNFKDKEERDFTLRILKNTL